MALYGGMMFTYRKDVVAKEAKECKEDEKTKENEEKKAEERGTGSPGAPGGGTSETQAAPSSEGVGGTAQPQTAVSKSPKPESTPTEATVTVTATRVACEGTSISKKSDGSVIRASYVAHDRVAVNVKSQTDSSESTGYVTHLSATTSSSVSLHNTESEANGKGNANVVACASSGIHAQSDSGSVAAVGTFHCIGLSEKSGDATIAADAGVSFETLPTPDSRGGIRMVLQNTIRVNMKNSINNKVVFVSRQMRKVTLCRKNPSKPSK